MKQGSAVLEMLCQKRMRRKTEHPTSKKEKELVFGSLATPVEDHFSPRCVVRNPDRRS